MLRERLKFVVVAAGAAERQPEEDLCRRAHHVIQLVEAVFLRIGRLIVPRSQAVVARSDPCLGRGVGEFVASELFEREAVKRHICVKRTDHVIPVSPD